MAQRNKITKGIEDAQAHLMDVMGENAPSWVEPDLLAVFKELERIKVKLNTHK